MNTSEGVKKLRKQDKIGWRWHFPPSNQANIAFKAKFSHFCHYWFNHYSISFLRRNIKVTPIRRWSSALNTWKCFIRTVLLIMVLFGVLKWHSYQICLFSKKCLATAYEIRFSHFQCFKEAFWTPTNILETMTNLLGPPVFLRLTSIKLVKKLPIFHKFCPKQQILTIFYNIFNVLKKRFGPQQTF